MLCRHIIFNDALASCGRHHAIFELPSLSLEYHAALKVRRRADAIEVNAAILISVFLCCGAAPRASAARPKVLAAITGSGLLED